MPSAARDVLTHSRTPRAEYDVGSEILSCPPARFAQSGEERLSAARNASSHSARLDQAASYREEELPQLG